VPQDPFPSPGGDGEEPDGSVPPPVAGTGPDAEHPGRPAPPPPAGPASPPPAGPEQGLFVCLPAENLDVARFAQHGQSDAMPPGPLLASVVHALVAQDGDGLSALSDDQLVGIIAATRRLESRIAWTQLAAVREFAARRPADPAGRDGGRARPGPGCEFAADELADELHLTWQSAAGHIAYACAVADRLPRTFAALADGCIHPVHARIIEDETSILSDQDAAQADEVLAEKAGSLTFGQLRSHAHRLILKLDPEAARKRKEDARQDAHVRRFREDSGNAGMVARELPPDEVLASWQHVEQWALDLRAAGLTGTLRELRVRAYLDLLQERDSRTAPATPQDGTGGSKPGDLPAGNDGPGGDRGPADPPAGHGSPVGTGGRAGPNGPADPEAGDSGPGPGHRAGLRPAGRPLRPGPHPALAPGRPDLPVRSGPAVPSSPPVQTGRGVVAGPAGPGRPDLASPVRTPLRHLAHRLSGLGRRDLPVFTVGVVYTGRWPAGPVAIGALSRNGLGGGCLAYRDDFRGHAALGSERLTQGSEKLVVVLPPLLGHLDQLLMASWSCR